MFGAADDEWVTSVGRYILNMGAVEMGTRLLIVKITGDEQHPMLSAALASRIGFIRKRFPRTDSTRHSWAMNALRVADKHTRFRNSVAHSPIAIAGLADGSYKIGGILNLTPADSENVGELITLEELRGRVDESAKIGRAILEMQGDFGEARS